MDDISLTIDRLAVAGLPADECARFAALLKAELQRALADHFAEARAGAEPSPDTLRALVLAVVHQLLQKERRA